MGVVSEDNFNDMEAPVLENTEAPLAGSHKWRLGLLLLAAGLAYRDLILWETATDFLPDVVGSFFYLSGTSPQLRLSLLLAR